MSSINTVGMSNIQNYNQVQNGQVSFGSNKDVQPDQKGDSFFSRHKKEIAIAGGVVSAVALAAGFVVLAKKGKFGDSAKDFVNKIFKPKNISQSCNIVEPKTTNAVTETVQTVVTPKAPSNIGTQISETTKDNVKKLSNGYEIRTYEVGNGTMTHYAKNGEIFKTVTVHDKLRQNATQRTVIIRGQTISDTLIKKDGNGNAIEVIVKKYNGDKMMGFRPENGGKETVTKITRDEAGKIIKKAQEIIDIPKKVIKEAVNKVSNPNELFA